VCAMGASCAASRLTRFQSLTADFLFGCAIFFYVLKLVQWPSSA
jgi:hypothetical protein